MRRYPALLAALVAALTATARWMARAAPEDPPTGYEVAATNRMSRRIFVTCIDGESRQCHDLAPGAEVRIHDSRSIRPSPPTWRLSIFPEFDREDGVPVYRHLFGIGSELEVYRPARPGTQRIRILITPQGPVLEGPVRRIPPA